MGLPLKNFVKIKASSSKNSVRLYSAPKEILNFYNLPLKNSIQSQPGGWRGGGIRILNSIIQCAEYFPFNLGEDCPAKKKIHTHRQLTSTNCYPHIYFVFHFTALTRMFKFLSTTKILCRN